MEFDLWTSHVSLLTYDLVIWKLVGQFYGEDMKSDGEKIRNESYFNYLTWMSKCYWRAP